MKIKILLALLVIVIMPSCVYVASNASTAAYVWPPFSDDELDLVNEFERHIAHE